MENQESVNQWRRPELLLLLIAALLSPLIGGQVTGQPVPFASPLGMFMGDPASAAGSRFFLSLFILGSLVFSFIRMRAVPIPRGKIGLCLAVMLGALAFAAVVSEFRIQSFEALLTWYLMVAAFFAAIAAGGRVQGPSALCLVMSVGGGITAVRGILEYMKRLSVEPSYRIFAGWSNPNAVAALFAILIPVSLALLMQKSRPLQITGAACALLMSLSLALTQSKGGTAAMLVGVLAWAIVHAVWMKKGWSFLAVLVVVAGYIVGTAWQTSAIVQKESAGAAPRIVSSGGEVEQSSGFRMLLWKSSVDLVKAKPYGWGPGTFRYENARSGRQTLTVYAHQTFLQLAAEGGIVAIVAFLGAAVLWFMAVFRKASAMTPEQNSLRAGIVGAIFAFGANGMVESALAYTGIGILIFMLLGVGLQLSSDASAPELMPPTMRRTLALVGGAVPFLALAWVMNSESSKSAMLTAVAQKDAQGMADASVALARNSLDGESLYYAGFGELRDAERRESLLRQAAMKWPSPRAHRALARLLAEQGNLAEAIQVTKQVFVRDPNNLPALSLLMDLELQNNNEVGAEEAALRLVKVEETTYFTVQSLPDLIPTETYRARFWLAGREEDADQKIALLQPAVNGYLNFLRRTVPLVKKFSEAGIDFGGVTPVEATENLNFGLDAARMLEIAYKEADDSSGASSAAEAVAELEAGLADL